MYSADGVAARDYRQRYAKRHSESHYFHPDGSGQSYASSSRRRSFYLHERGTSLITSNHNLTIAADSEFPDFKHDMRYYLCSALPLAYYSIELGRFLVVCFTFTHVFC